METLATQAPQTASEQKPLTAEQHRAEALDELQVQGMKAEATVKAFKKLSIGGAVAGTLGLAASLYSFKNPQRWPAKILFTFTAMGSTLLAGASSYALYKSEEIKTYFREGFDAERDNIENSQHLETQTLKKENTETLADNFEVLTNAESQALKAAQKRSINHAENLDNGVSSELSR